MTHIQIMKLEGCYAFVVPWHSELPWYIVRLVWMVAVAGVVVVVVEDAAVMEAVVTAANVADVVVLLDDNLDVAAAAVAVDGE